MFQQVRFYSLWLVYLCVFIIIGVIGCGEDDESPWVGTWKLETVDGESVQTQFEALELLFEFFTSADEEDSPDIEISYTDEWTFEDDGTWHRDVTIVAPNDDNVVQTTTIEVMGTYTLSDSNYTITPESVNAQLDGVDLEIEDDDLESEDDALDSLIRVPDFESKETDTGTWLLEGNTLTLTSDIRYVLGFKKEVR